MSFRSVLRSVHRSLPSPLARLGQRSIIIARSFRDLPLKHRVFGERAYFVPPLYLMEDGARDFREFEQNGLDAFRRFQALGLKPTDRILDIGSGVGRKTLPLLGYVTTGSYEGIDPIAKQVRWCTERISSRYPKFRFQRIDVWSKLYNPSGKIKPSEYKFPFADAEFDFVIMGSVFTHMFPRDVDHYISEISRLLKPGGRGWITFFLLNQESLAAIAAARSTLNLIHEVEQGSRADNPDHLETAVAHPERAMLDMFAHHNIQAEVAEYGSWCGRQADYYQDIVKISTALP
jgi:SAM-dependent methyltransferase